MSTSGAIRTHSGVCQKWMKEWNIGNMTWWRWRWPQERERFFGWGGKWRKQSRQSKTQIYLYAICISVAAILGGQRGQLTPHFWKRGVCCVILTPTFCWNRCVWQPKNKCFLNKMFLQLAIFSESLLSSVYRIFLKVFFSSQNISDATHCWPKYARCSLLSLISFLNLWSLFCMKMDKGFQLQGLGPGTR